MEIKFFLPEKTLPMEPKEVKKLFFNLLSMMELQVGDIEKIFSKLILNILVHGALVILPTVLRLLLIMPVELLPTINTRRSKQQIVKYRLQLHQLVVIQRLLVRPLQAPLQQHLHVLINYQLNINKMNFHSMLPSSKKISSCGTIKPGLIQSHLFQSCKKCLHILEQEPMTKDIQFQDRLLL